MRDGGKGDKPRPLSVSIEQFDNNFDAIFGKKEKKQLEDAMDYRAKELMQEVKELIKKSPLEPIPFAGMVDTDEV